MRALLLFSIILVLLFPDITNAQNIDCPSIWQQGIMGDCIGKSGMFEADIDNDGETELIVGTSIMWYVLKWSNDQQDYVLKYMSPYIEYHIEILTLLDVDDDGTREVLIGTSQGNVFVFDAATATFKDTINVDNCYFDIKQILLADADNDGNTELVLCTNYKTYLLNRSGGEYSLKLTIDQGGYDLRIGDVDGDQANELVYSTGLVFRLEQNLPVLLWEFDHNYNSNGRLLLEDVDADGIPEIIYSGQYSVLAVFDADIHQSKWIGDSGGVDAILMADTNDDGIKELIVGENQFGDIIGLDVLDGSERWRVQNPGHGVNFLCVADTDNDGDLELAWADNCSSTGEDYMHICSLPGLEHEWTSKSTWGSFSVKVANVDNDPLPEVITLSSKSGFYSSGIISIYDALSRTLEWESEPDFIFSSNSDGMKSMEINDIDNDSHTEIIISGEVYGSPAIWIVDPVNHAVKSSYTMTNELTTFVGFGIADTDLNGTKEIIAASKQALYIINPANWSIIWQTTVNNLSNYISGIQTENIDEDSQPEIILICDKIVVYDALTHERWDTPNHGFICFFTYDCNGDGIKEVIAGNKDGEIAILNGVTHEITWLPIHTEHYINGIRVADISGGPDPELILAFDGRVHFSTFAGQMLSTDPVGPENFRVNFEVADYDLDGKPDIFAGTMIQVIEWDRQCWECVAFSADTSTTNASCNRKDGSATVLPYEGTEPYYIQWSTGETTPEVANLPAGVYSCNLLDSHGCKITKNISISENPFLAVISLLFPASVYKEDCDGRAVISTIGGMPPYRYVWDSDTTLMQSDTISDLCVGSYELQILDANDCSDLIQFTIDQSTEPPVLNYTFKVYPVPTHDKITVEIEWPTGSSFNNSPVKAELKTIQGQRIFTYELKARKNSLDLSSLATGMYVLVLSTDQQEEVVKIEKFY